MEISLEELKKFANDPLNSIKFGECLKNAQKIYNAFGGIILDGDVLFYDIKKKEVKSFAHTWNILKYQNGNLQIIDIANYLVEKEGIYFSYIGKEITLNQLENKIEAHEECKDRLKNNCQVV